MRCFYRHRAHEDPFFLPGLQDLTASVDFTALAEAGVNAGFDFAGYCAQSSFLLANGLSARLLEIAGIEDEATRYKANQAVKRLTLPGEMGERFRVLALARDYDRPLTGFALRDLTRTL